MGSIDMQEYFKSISVNPSEAQVIFTLLDGDESGELSAGEITKGLVQLRGNATALDLKLLMYDFQQLNQRVVQFMDETSYRFNKLGHLVDGSVMRTPTDEFRLDRPSSTKSKRPRT